MRRSIHAVALMNAAELASGLLVLHDLPDGLRAIIVDMSAKYVAKARGTVVAEARADTTRIAAGTPFPVDVTLRDGNGNVVSTAVITWMVSSSASGKEKRC